jgi:hypothetical protein
MRRVTTLVFLLGSLALAPPAGAAREQQQQQQPIPMPVAAQQTTAPLPSQGQQTPPPTTRLPGVVPEMTLPPRAPALPTLTANVKLDLTITDTYTGTPVKKTVSMLVLNGSSGMIRTTNRLANGSNVGLNIDAAATIHQGGLVTVRVTFEYTPAQLAAFRPESREEEIALRTQQAERGLSPTSQPAQLHETLSVVLQDGKPLLVSQSADPTTDRKVTVELMATILK